MNPRLFALLIPAALAGCAAGSTMRVAEGEDSTANEPVSLAPTPAGEPEATPSPDYDTGRQPAPERVSGAEPAQGYAPYAGTRTLDIRRIGQWTRTGIGEARRLVIRDANGWDQFWSELAVGDRPDVDFSRDIVVAVAAGQRSTGGHEIVVDRVTQADGELRIDVLEKSPGPNCMTTASLTQPVDVVVVPAADARSWRFVERKEIRGCR
jgi:PrcB C-terminal